jgi:alpha-glucosidase
MLRRPLVLLLLLALGATPAAGARTLRLSDGTRVAIGDAGDVALVAADGRPLLATAPGAAPTARWFDETVTALVGQFAFARANVTAAPLARVRGARRLRDGSVRLKLAGRGGPGDRGQRATLQIRPEIPGQRTRLTLTLRARRGGAPAPASLALPVRCDADATFHGFGGQYDTTDQRGHAFPLFVSEQGIGRDPAKPQFPVNGTPHTTYFPMPYWLDARGWGALVLTDRRVEVDLCASDPDVAWVEAVAGAPLEVLVFHGPTPLDVIRQLGDVVGRPKQPPSWAWRLWMSAQGGRTAVEAKVAALQAADVPLGVVWSQDWTGVRVNFDGGLGVQYRWGPDLAHYPDLAGLVADLHAQGLRFLTYVNPFVMQNLQHWAPMDGAGRLLHTADGASYGFLTPAGIGGHPDLSDPGAREYVKSAFRTAITTYGIDGWMSDFGEWTPTDAVWDDGRDGTVGHQTFPVAWHGLSREVFDELRPDGDWVTFARSGWTGVQRVAMIHWVGDQETDWSTTDGLPTVVPALVNLGLSGQPFVAHDVAGFSGTTAPPSTKELFLRWTELGAFTPVMRTHDGADRNNNWRWDADAETTAHFRRFARIHDALRPELEALAAEAAATSAPMLRHPLLVFPDDPASRDVDGEFLLGTTLLVAPVVVEGATTRDVRLPPGTWYHVWTGTAYAGGTTVTVPAPIGQPPVFSRDVDRPDLRAIE